MTHERYFLRHIQAMKLNELTSLLVKHADKPFKMLLPGGGEVPLSFHVTEVGYVIKQFIDCGGHTHRSETCQLQAWVGGDEDHRLEAGKLVGIFQKATDRGILPQDAGAFPVEIEYEDLALSQFPISGHEIVDGSVVLQLKAKHTDCLAKEQCGAPATPEAACCGGKC
jgi:Family of unknown function (DUF6428)